MEITRKEGIMLAVVGALGLAAMTILLVWRPAPLELRRSPSTGEGQAPGGERSWDEALAHARLVDVNRATVEELARLPHVGPALATRIVASRTARGRFQTPEELRHVKGIGPKTYEALAGYVTTEAEVR